MNSLVCKEHDNPFTQVQIDSKCAKLICEECFIERLDQVQNIIHIKKASKYVSYFISKTNIRDSFPTFVDQVCQYDENELKKQQTIFENKIKTIQKQLDNTLLQINAYIQFLAETRKQILQDLYNVLKFENFQQLYKNLEQKDDNQNPDVIEQIETQFYQYFQSIQNNKKKLKEDIFEIFRKHSAKICNSPHMQFPKWPLNNQIEELIQSFATLFNQAKPVYIQLGLGNIADSSLLSFDYMYYLHSVLVERATKKIQQSNLIYKGTRDGLSGKAFQQKIDNKQNLLMIFKQKQTNAIFGGYSPCLWKSQQQFSKQYAPDDTTATSFLFSQTNNQIYPIKKDSLEKAIYCQFEGGPCFGQGGDLQIKNNFTGSSNLGCSYFLAENLKDKKSTILSGASNIDIEECEIYEILFSL